MNTYKYTYNKAKLTLSVDKNLIKMAKENKINISRFLEEKLREYFVLNENGRGGIRTRDHWLRRPAPYPG